MVLKEMEGDLRRGMKLEGSGRKKLTKNKNERKSKKVVGYVRRNNNKICVGYV